MDHVFRGLGLGDAYGLGDAPESSDLVIQVSSAGLKSPTPVTLHVWETPSKNRLLVSLDFRCPHCDFPLNAKATQMGVTIAEADGGLSMSMRMPLSCSGHWEHMNEYGQTSGRQIKCGWQACIRDNQFHHPRCGGSNFRNDFDPTRCVCSQLAGQ